MADLASTIYWTPIRPEQALNLEKVTETLSKEGWVIHDNNIVPAPLSYDKDNNPIYMKNYPISPNGKPTPAAVIEIQEGKINEIRVGSYNISIKTEFFPIILNILNISYR